MFNNYSQVFVVNSILGFDAKVWPPFKMAQGTVKWSIVGRHLSSNAVRASSWSRLDICITSSLAYKSFSSFRGNANSRMCMYARALVCP
jgi:UDP-N-acetylmuramate-alanine ligase